MQVNLDYQYGFALVSGQGLGTSYSSAAQIGAIIDHARFGQAKLACFVNLNTQNFIVKDRLFYAVEQAENIALQYIYNSLSTANPWRLNLASIKSVPATIADPLIFEQADGHVTHYVYDPDRQAYIAPALTQGTCYIQQQSDGSWIQTNPASGHRYCFSELGQLQWVMDIHGRKNTYHYNDDNQLQWIKGWAQNKYELRYGEGTVAFYLHDIDSQTTRCIQTCYFDTHNRLTKTSIGDYEINYRYLGDTSLLSGITQSDGTRMQPTFSGLSGQIAALTMGEQAPMHFRKTAASCCQFIDAIGQTTTVEINDQAQVLRIIKPAGLDGASTQTWQYAYDGCGQLKTITSPNNAKTELSYDQWGLIKQRLKPNGQCKQYYRDDMAQLVAEVNTVTVNTESTRLTTYYVNARGTTTSGMATSRRLFEITPIGCVTRLSYSAGGGLASQCRYLKNAFDTGTISIEQLPSVAQLQTWAGLQPKTEVELIDYWSRDSRGLPKQTIAFNAVSGSGSGIINAKTRLEQDTWAYDGKNIEKKVLQQGQVYAVTTHHFDALRRLTKAVNANGDTTTISYVDNTMTKTLPNGLQRTYTRNSAGYVTAIDACAGSATDHRVTHILLDGIGRAIQTTGSDGQHYYYGYDQQNQHALTVTPLGYVTAYIDDRVNAYRQVTRYANAIALSELPASATAVQMASLITADPVHDRCLYTIMDQSYREQWRIEPSGAIVQTQHDELDRPVCVTAYASKVALADVAAIIAGSATPLDDVLHDRSTDYIYDHCHSKAIAIQDGAGYVQAMQYDLRERVVQTIHYAKPTSRREVPTAVGEADALAYRYYNPLNQCVAEVDAEGYATVIDYQPGGQCVQRYRYADVVVATPRVGCDYSSLLPQKTASDQVTQYQHDLLGRQIATQLPKAVLKTQTFDALGHIVARSHGDDPERWTTAPVQTRSTLKQWNGWGEHSATAPPRVAAVIAAIQADGTLNQQQKQTKIDAVWQQQSLRYRIDPVTGLTLATVDVAPDPDVNAITWHYYDSERRLCMSVDPMGCVLLLQRNAFGDITEKTQLATPIASDKLATLKGGFINSAVLALLSYDSSHDSVLTRVFNRQGRWIKRTDGEGFVTTRHFNAFDECDLQHLPVANTTPSLLLTQTFDQRGLKLSVTKTAASLSTTEQWQYDNPLGHCSARINPTGDMQRFIRDKRGYITQDINALGAVTHHVIDAFGRIVQTTDALQHRTAFSYNDATRTKTKTQQTASDDATWTTVVDAFDQVVTRTDALNSKTTISYGPDGQWQVKTNALGHSQSQQFDLRGLLIVSVSILGTQTHYRYQLNRLIQTETQDAAGLAYVTTTVWNAQKLRGSVQQGACLTTYGYDKRGLINSQCVDPSGLALVTANTHNGQRQLVETFQHAHVDTATFATEQCYDGLARHTGETVDPDVLAIKKQKILDKSSRVIARIDGNGGITWYCFDAAGRQRFSVNAVGGVTEQRYNSANQRIQQLRYFAAIDASKVSAATTLAQLQALVMTTPGQDQVEFYFYDQLGHQRYCVNVLGAVTETQCNAEGYLIKATRYAALIDPADLGTMTTADVAAAIQVNATDDRTDYYVYDALGNQRFIFDASGAVQEQRYNAAKQKIAWICYANKVLNAATLAAMPADDIVSHLSLDHDHDRYQYWYFDSLKRPLYHVNALGGVTFYQHDQASHLTLSCRFFAAQAMPTAYAALRQILTALVPNPAVDSIETRHYDVAGREVKRIDPCGFYDKWQYDGASRKTLHTDKAGHDWHTAYDGANRAYQLTSPSTQLSSIVFADGALSKKQTQAAVVTLRKLDNNNNIVKVTTMAGEQQHVVTKAYDPLNNITRHSIENVPLDDPSKPASLTDRPETLADVTSTTVYTSGSRPLVAIAEDGGITFYIYEARGLLLYRINPEKYVTAFTYDAFGKQTMRTRYAAPLNHDLSSYVTKGIPLAQMVAWVGELPAEGRSHKTVYDKQDNAKLEQLDAVYYVAADETGTLSPALSRRFNAFANVIETSRGVSATRARSKWFWYDRAGNVIARCSADGHVTQFVFNAWSHQTYRIEFATPLTTLPTHDTSFAELMAMVLHHVDDHHIQTLYDLMHRKSSVMTMDVVTQQVHYDAKMTPTVQDLAPRDIGEKYQYTPLSKLANKTDANGSQCYYFYDERACLIAKTDVPRTQVRPDNSTKVIIPAAFYGVDFMKRRVSVFKPYLGVTSSGVFPVPVATNTSDRLTLMQVDPRGLVLIKQDANRVLHMYTFTAAKKQALYYAPATNWQQNSDRSFTKVMRLVQKKMQYDLLGRNTLIMMLDNTAVEQTTAMQYDAFNMVAKGPGGDVWPEEFRYDAAGRLWFAFDHGVATLYLTDLSGRVCWQVQSMNQDLSTLSITDLPTVFANRDNLKDYAMTQKHYTQAGRLASITKPRYVQPAQDLAVDCHGDEAKGEPGDGVTIESTWAMTTNTWGRIHTIQEPTTHAPITHYYNKQNTSTRITYPSVSVMDETGKVTTIAPVDRFANNALARRIAYVDANNHISATLRDEANQITHRIDAEGIVQLQSTFDCFGQGYLQQDSRLKTWQKYFNGTSQVISIKYPSGKVFYYDRNEMDQVITETNPANQSDRYAFDCRGNMITHWLPNADSFQFRYDRNHLPVQNWNRDFHCTIDRNYFGWTRSEYVDVSGCHRLYEQDYAGQTIRVYDLAASKHGSMLVFDPTVSKFTTDTKPTPAANTYFSYLTPGILWQQEDRACGQLSSKLYDANGRLISISQYINNKCVCRDSYEYNALSWVTSITRDSISYKILNGIRTNSTNIMLDYDPVGNRRRIFVPGSDSQPIHQGWYTYDKSDRVLIDNGVMAIAIDQNKIAVTKGSQSSGVWPQGTAYSYKNGLRYQQNNVFNIEWSVVFHKLVASDITDTTLTYSDDGLVQGAAVSYDSGYKAYDLTWKYNDAQQVMGFYSKSSEGVEGVNKKFIYDSEGNGWLKKYQSSILCVGLYPSSSGLVLSPYVVTTDFYNYTAFGLAKNQNTLATYIANHKLYYSDKLSTSVLVFDSEQVASVSGTLTNKNGTGPYSQLNHYYTPMGDLQGVTGATDSMLGPSGADCNLYFLNNLAGMPLLQWEMGHLQDGTPAGGVLTNFIFLPNGNLIGELQLDALGLIKTRPPFTVMPCVSPQEAVRFKQTSDTMIVEPNQNYGSIAAQAFFDPRYSVLIKAFCGVTLAPGQKMDLPHILNAYEKAGEGIHWQTVIEKIQSGLNPDLKPAQPKRHHSFLVELLEIIVSIVVAIFFPEMIGVDLTKMGLEELMLVSSEAGAVSDIASQVVAMTFGEQEGFNFKEILASALDSGLTAGISRDLGINKLENYAAIFTETASVNASVQTLELMTGLRRHFDIKTLIERSLSATIQSAYARSKTLSHNHPELTHLADHVTEALVDAAISGQHVNLAQLLGEVTAEHLHDAFATPKPGDTRQQPYQQAQQAGQTHTKAISLSSALIEQANQEQQLSKRLIYALHHPQNYWTAQLAKHYTETASLLSWETQAQTQAAPQPTFIQGIESGFDHAVAQSAAGVVNVIKNPRRILTGLEHFSTQIVYGLYNTAQHPIAMLYHLWHTGEQGVRDYQRDNRYQRGQVWGAGLFGVGSFVASDGLLDGDVLAGGAESSVAESRAIAATHVRESRNILKQIGLDASERNQLLHSFDLETFRIERASGSRQVFRVFDDNEANLQGRYTSPHFLENQTDRIVKYALPNNSATRLAVVDIPDGSMLFTGKIAPQINISPGLVGGERQIFLLGRLDQYTFTEVAIPREELAARGASYGY